MKSCRKGPQIKHVQYKCTMCFKTFTMYIVFVLYLQNRAFPNRVGSIFVMSSNARGCQFRFRMKENLKWK